MRTLCRALTAAICLGLLPVLHAAEPAGLLANFGRASAIIETSRDICLWLEVYLADSRREQAQGLMRVEKMDEFEGMLFRYDRPAHISMWMKNTYLPLDMLFIRGDGTIAYIAEKTTPLSLDSIRSPEPVSMVLELGAEFSRRWTIRDGNRLLLVESF